MHKGDNMIINFDEEEFINNIINTLLEYRNEENEDIYIDDISETVFEDVEEWFANYGLQTDLIYEIIEKLKEMNIKVIQ